MTNEEQNSGITFGQRYGYALGEFGFTFILMFLAYYMLYFLTDIAMIPADTAALVYSICQWVEVITILIIGVVIDKVRMKRNRYSPWLIIGSAVSTVGIFISFTKMPISNYAVYGVVFIISYTLCYTGYNAMWIGYRSLLGVLGKSSDDRLRLATATAQMSTFSALLFSYLGTKILIKLIDVKNIYGLFSLALGVIMILCMFIVKKIVNPYDKPLELIPAEADGEHKKNEKMSIGETVKGYLSCLTKPMVLTIFAVGFRTSISTTISTLMIYYMTYVIGSTAGLSYYMILNTAASLLATFLVPLIHKKMEKLLMWRLSAVGNIVTLLCTYFFAKTTLSFMILLAVNQIFLSIGGSMITVFISDVADYNDKVRHIDAHAFSFSFGALSLNLAQIIGSIVASYGLVIIGYNAADPHPEQYADGISFILTIATSICVLIALIFYHFYDLTEDRMKEIEKM